MILKYFYISRSYVKKLLVTSFDFILVLDPCFALWEVTEKKTEILASEKNHPYFLWRMYIGILYSETSEYNVSVTFVGGNQSPQLTECFLILSMTHGTYEPFTLVIFFKFHFLLSNTPLVESVSSCVRVYLFLDVFCM